VHLFSTLNANARIVWETAEWKGVCVLKKEGAVGSDDGHLFPQTKPKG
jgi:hypothetical protein